ncbi:MAG: O-antigen ligase family protein [Chloroflexi bacterium]|nr:O-antigen ligase family protein [Chloroflexota bacterium]
MRDPLDLPRVRTPRIYRVCDGFTEGLVYAMIIFSPWAFGSTDPWANRVMNLGGYLLGGLLIIKWLTRWRTGYRPPQWSDPSLPEMAGDNNRHRPSSITALMAVLTMLLLAYCLTSALNARATFYLEELRFDYHPYIPWLPHSYDRGASWFAFWSYLGLACFFWSLRDWLLGKTRQDRHAEREEGYQESRSSSTLPALRPDWPFSQSALGTPYSALRRPHFPFIPERLRRLFWVLCLNGAVLGLEAILQRLNGTNKLLWLIEPRWNKAADSQFGPYPYRSNAAQYFNLLWPVCLGFWWTLRRRAKEVRRKVTRIGEGSHLILLPCAIIVTACPIISISRGGAIVSLLAMLLAFPILIVAGRRGRWPIQLGVFMIFAATTCFAGYLGWEKLQERFETIFTDVMSGRGEIYQNAVQMARDFPTLGTGPGSFAALYQLYRPNPYQVWHGYVHDDWLESRITFGWVGFSLIMLLLLLILARWFGSGGILAKWEFVALIWLALGGCLAHAKVDFPFQTHSVVFLFTLLCCVLSCVSRKE